MALERLHHTITRTDFERLFSHADTVTLNGLQLKTAYRGLFTQFNKSYDERIFSEESLVVNNTKDIIHALSVRRFSPKSIKLDITTADNCDSPRTPISYLFARAVLHTVGKDKELDELVKNGMAVMTVRRLRLDRRTLGRIDSVANRLKQSNWAQESFIKKAVDPTASIIPKDQKERNRLLRLEQKVFDDVNTAIVFQVLPKDEKQIEKAEEFTKLLNDAVNPLEKVYISQLIDSEIIRHEWYKARKAIRWIAATELLIGGGELLGLGWIAKWAFLFGGDFALSAMQTAVAKERFKQSWQVAMASRYDLFFNFGQSIYFSKLMDDMVKKGYFNQMVEAYVASMILSQAISVLVTGLSAAKGKWKDVPGRIGYFLKNPAGSGPLYGTGASILFMEGINKFTTYLHTPGGRAWVECIAGLGEVGGVFLNMYLKEFNDWINYTQTANAMIASVKNNSKS